MPYLRKNNLRVAIVISNPLGWNFPNNYGGGEVVTCELINRIKKIDYTVITPSSNLPLNKNVNVKLIKISRLNNILSFIEFSTKCLFYLIKNNSKFDIFYASTTNISEIIPVFLASKICRKKTITKYHLSVYKKSGKKFLISILNNLRQEKISGISLFIKWVSITTTYYLLKKFDAVFCVSKSSLIELQSYLPKKKLYLVENGIDIEKLSKYKTNKKIYDICFLGRLEKYKGIYEFIGIAKKLNLKAIIIGSGSENNRINACLRRQETMTNENMKNFHILGHLKDDRFKYLSQSKYLLVLSNSSEGFGLTIGEALAVGTNVICLKNNVLEKVYEDIPKIRFVETKGEIEKILKKDNGSRVTDHNLHRFDIKETVKKETNALLKIV